jgi:DNA repair photolyase
MTNKINFVPQKPKIYKENRIGVTERGDAAIVTEWLEWTKKGNATLLITKDSKTLYDVLEKNDKEAKYNIIIHSNITGYGGTNIEPNVPKPEVSIEYLRKFVDKYGDDRVVLRIDPIIPYMPHLEKSLKVYESTRDLDIRVRISFFDNYKHSYIRMMKVNEQIDQYEFHAPLKLRKELYEKFGRPEMCGEPGFKSVGCISEIDCKILGVDSLSGSSYQRAHCTCLANKYELLKEKNPCKHACKYCYWKDKK